MLISPIHGWHEVQERLNKAAEIYHLTHGRTSSLIAVSKTHSAEKIIPLLQAGQRHFGENKLQEAQAKWPALKAQFSEVILHLIGTLQTNKAADAVALFDMIHTLDREKLARALHKEMEKQQRHLPLLIQINTGEEVQKSGIPPGEALDFTRFCISELSLPVRGFMCIPPADEEPAPHFMLLKTLAQKAGPFMNLPAHQPRPLLSMGMSNDFELAAAMGADFVRVGSAIFGERRVPQTTNAAMPC